MQLKDGREAVAAIGFGSGKVKLLDLTSNNWENLEVKRGAKVYARMTSHGGDAFILGGQEQSLESASDEIFRVDANKMVTLEPKLVLNTPRMNFKTLKVPENLCRTN